MVRNVLVALSLVAFASFGQEGRLMIYPKQKPNGYRVPGLLSASMTFSPGTMLNRDQTNFYLSGFAECQMDHKVSLRGDTYIFLNASSDQPYVNEALRTYFGAFYHLNQQGFGNWDVKIGFQPGITYMKRSTYDALGESVASEPWLSPSFSVSIGADYYVWKYFHFFANLAYVNSSLRGLPGGADRTDELLFSAGLGFQIRTRK